MFSVILNIVSTKPKHKTYNRKIDLDAFYLQEIKRVGQSLYFDNFYSLILPDNIIIYGNLLKYITVTAHLFAVKMVHNANLILKKDKNTQKKHLCYY